MTRDIPKEAASLVLKHPDQLIATVDGRACMFSPDTVAQVVKYLYWFGYIAYEVSKNVTIEDIANALKKFQDWFRVHAPQESGKIGPKTLKATKYPRCGCPDYFNGNGEHAAYRRLREAIVRKKNQWNRTGLKYFIKTYVGSSSLPKTAQEEIIATAWRQWTEIAKIDISRSKTAKVADLIIDTGRGRSADFDGPEGTLAWAYMPDGHDRQLLMRFDLDETWTPDPRDNGVAMLNVACHEFGHMLGLDHSKRPRALMAPFYNESISCPQKDDDIARIQKLYGPRMTVSKAEFDEGIARAKVAGLPDTLTLGFGEQTAVYRLDN